MSLKEEYRARKAAQEAKYKNPILERLFGWFRSPPDRFAGLIAIFTLLLVGATVKLWWATDDLVQDAKETNRAWIAPTAVHIIGPFETGKPVQVQIFYYNPGRSPALGIRTWFELRYVEATDKDFVEANTTCSRVQPVLGSESLYPSPLNTTISTTFKGAAIDQIAINKIQAGTLIPYLNGCFRYFAVDKPRKSGFCFYLSSDNSQDPVVGRWFAECPLGHESD